MKLKSILLTAVATISLATATLAQVPNYVPTNGLISWWPFNGNANDESGNGNNGTVSGATLTGDRFGNANKAFTFDGANDYIDIGDPIVNSLDFQGGAFTISAWFNATAVNGNDIPLLLKSTGSNVNSGDYGVVISNNTNNKVQFGMSFGNGNGAAVSSVNSINTGIWQHLVIVFNSTSDIKLYLDNSLGLSCFSCTNNPSILNNPSTPLRFGWYQTYNNFFNGKLDDIGIWNRALTQQEITDLYNAVNCSNNTAITPQTNSLTIGSTASFTATTSDPNPNFVWQSDFGQGFQTLNNFGNYSGVNSAALNIANVQLSEHNQPIRVISTSGNCIDTSNVAVINILDTCLVIVYDTLLTTVTDTLIINALITGINPPNNLNTLKVFPNPASTHITIDYGNFNAMSGYTLKIVNAIGQTVFTTPINQQTSYIDLSTWTGNGIYFVQLIDTQNNTIENRKIVIQ